MIRFKILVALVMLLTSQACSTKKTEPNNVRILNDQFIQESDGKADTSLIKNHLIKLTRTNSFRTYKDVEQLNQTAEYISSIFSQHTDNVSFQLFSVGNKTYKNVIASFGPTDATRIIVGAHYDVCGSQQGADDNASGVTGLLELARLLQGKSLKYRIDLVAYSLEEPPYFRTEYMGSFVHAESLHKMGVPVYGMISLEMIGYFNDEPGSQSYPDGIPPGYFGDKGDYIALVMKTGSGEFPEKFCSAFKAAKTIKSNQYKGPAYLPGVDFSDHLNYWIFNFEAMMITDTSLYRNPNYHTAGDVLETLDLKRMAGVIDGVFEGLTSLKD